MQNQLPVEQSHLSEQKIQTSSENSVVFKQRISQEYYVLERQTYSKSIAKTEPSDYQFKVTLRNMEIPLAKLALVASEQLKKHIEGMKQVQITLTDNQLTNRVRGELTKFAQIESKERKRQLLLNFFIAVCKIKLSSFVTQFFETDKLFLLNDKQLIYLFAQQQFHTCKEIGVVNQFKTKAELKVKDADKLVLLQPKHLQFLSRWMLSKDLVLECIEQQLSHRLILGSEQ